MRTQQMTDLQIHKVVLEVAPDGVAMLAAQGGLLSMALAGLIGRRNNPPFRRDSGKALRDTFYPAGHKLHACHS